MSARKAAGLFDHDLPSTVEAVVRRVEKRAGQPITTKKVKSSALGACIGYFTDEGAPQIDAVGKPALEDVVLEVLRLQLRKGRGERDMPYGEMQHEINRALCIRLFRILEDEVLLSEASAHGVACRRRLTALAEESLLDPLRSGSYGKGEKEPLRTRLGALDALEMAVACVNRSTAKSRLREVSLLDDKIARPSAFMFAVMDRYRPFDSAQRMTGAYYVAVPFLFESRNSA
jgi:hypothetical protein